MCVLFCVYCVMGGRRVSGSEFGVWVIARKRKKGKIIREGRKGGRLERW